MSNLSGTNRFWLFIFFTLTLLSCSLIKSPGTIDVHTWVRWLQDYLDYGPFAGYAHNKTDYPPLMIFIFYFFAQSLSLINIDSFLAVKVTILTFSMLSSILVFYWTKNPALTAFFHITFILNTVALGYADIILSFFLILSLWQLKNKNILFSACAFSLAIFIKWQALIILPFIFLYALSIINSREIIIAKTFKQTVLPFLVITSLVIYLFGLIPIWNAFTWAFEHPWLSGYALNIHWVLTFLYQAFYPELFGGLHNGEISYISSAHPPAIFLICKGIALLMFLYTVFIFYQSKKNIETLLVFSLLGYLTYFTFNTGVHENHLFLAAWLSILLTAQNKQYLPLAVYIAIAFNLNMFLFYGVNGHSGQPHVINGIFDVTLIFAIINTCFFVRLWFVWVVKKNYPRVIEVV